MAITPAEPPADDAVELGRRLREHRQSVGLTLQQVADETGVTRSFVSQVEAGKVNPSMSTLKRIAAALDTRLGALLDAEYPPAAQPNGSSGGRSEVAVVRRDHRKMIKWPDSEALSYLLTPDLQRRLEVLLSVYEPGHSSGDEPYVHEGEEFGLVLSGRYEVQVDGETYVLEQGDTIYFPSHLPHSMRALDETAETLWAITPPSF